MLISVTLLRHAKSENSIQPELGIDTCEDYALADLKHAVVAVTDGVGSTSFANVWAKILAEHAVREPLHSADPFEVQGWLRRAQPEYKKAVPEIAGLPPLAQKKARLGAASTLLQMTIEELGQDSNSARLRLLAFGDTCAMLLRQEHTFECFPYTTTSAFAQAPVSLPANPLEYNLEFHQPEEFGIWVQPGDCLICLTDAVAYWVLQAIDRGSTPEVALLDIASQTPESWGAWVDLLRTQGSLVDDDSTAVVLRFFSDDADAADHMTGLIAAVETKSATTEYFKDMAIRRYGELVRALKSRDLPAVAMAWGDGALLQEHRPGLLPDTGIVDHARKAARSINQVWWALKQSLAWPDPARRAKALEAMWNTHAEVLNWEPCVEELRQSLVKNGVHLDVDSFQDQRQFVGEPIGMMNASDYTMDPLDRTRKRLAGAGEYAKKRPVIRGWSMRLSRRISRRRRTGINIRRAGGSRPNTKPK